MQVVTLTWLQSRRLMRGAPFLRRRRLRSVRLLAGLILLALFAAHAAHLPVLAHDELAVVGEAVDGHHLSVAHERHQVEPPPTAFESASRLEKQADHGVECVAELATMPTRILVPGSLPSPTSIAREATAALSSPRGALVVLPVPTRRHLLLQVLLR